MRRMHLVELEDLPWFPAILRDGGTAFLEFAERASGHGRRMVGPLERALDATGETRIVDLCSGGGGPAATIADELAHNPALRFADAAAFIADAEAHAAPMPSDTEENLAANRACAV